MIANPINTLTSVLSHFCPNIPASQFHGLSRLDQNRAKGIIASKCHVSPSEVKNVTVWGNHSDTQVADLDHCTIEGVEARTYIPDRKWIEEDFVSKVAHRGFEIVSYRGKTSNMSCAAAIKDHLHDWCFGTDQLSTMALVSDGTKYGVEQGLTFAFPCTGKGQFDVSVADLELSDTLAAKIKESKEEVLQEWNLTKEILKI